MWEAKDLRNGKDTFATILVNGREFARTNTVWSSQSPYFYSEFSFTLDNDLQTMSVQLRDLRKKNNFLIGSATVPLSRANFVTKGNNNSSWFPLTKELDANLQLQLQVNLTQNKFSVAGKGNRWFTNPNQFSTQSTGIFIQQEGLHFARKS